MDKREVPQVASQGHKRKRSIQDTPINLNKIRAAGFEVGVSRH